MKRIAIVGAGGIGTWHAHRWAQLQENQDRRVTLEGYYDLSTAAAEKAASKHGGRIFRSLEELLDAVDVVDVCTSTPHHKAPVLAAAAAGKDIVCEKPLARDLRDAREMVTACQEAGVRLFVAQVVRFFSQFALARTCITNGDIGRPAVIRTVRGGAPPGPSGRPWFTDFEQSGGVVMDVSIHDLDFARWCFGDVEKVFARGLTFAGVAPYDHALISLRFKNGAIGHVEGSWAYPPGRFRTGFEIAGDQGLIEWDDRDPAPLTVTLKSAETPGAPSAPQPQSPLAPPDDPYFRELAHFVDCLESGAPFLVSAQDGLEAVRLSLAAVESIRTGEPIYLDSYDGKNQH